MISFLLIFYMRYKFQFLYLSILPVVPIVRKKVFKKSFEINVHLRNNPSLDFSRHLMKEIIEHCGSSMFIGFKNLKMSFSNIHCRRLCS